MERELELILEANLVGESSVELLCRYPAGTSPVEVAEEQVHLAAGQLAEAMDALQIARTGAAKSLVLDDLLGEFTTGGATAPTNPPAPA